MGEPVGVSARFNGVKPNPREPYVELAIQDYIRKRAQGLSEDSPLRPFPRDGQFSFLSPPSQKGWGHVEYVPGKGDITWMEERDQKFLKRQEKELAEKLRRENEEKIRIESMNMHSRLEDEVKKALDEVIKARAVYDKTVSEIEEKHSVLRGAMTPHNRKLHTGALDYLVSRGERERQLLRQREERTNELQKQLTDYLRANPGAGKPTVNSESLEKTNAILREQMAGMQRQMLLLQQTQIVPRVPTVNAIDNRSNPLASNGEGKTTTSSEALEKKNAILCEQVASMQRQILILQQANTAPTMAPASTAAGDGTDTTAPNSGSVSADNRSNSRVYNTNSQRYTVWYKDYTNMAIGAVALGTAAFLIKKFR